MNGSIHFTSRPNRGRRCTGQSLVIIALLMVALFGFVALSLDVGRLYVEKKKMQNVTDAAALAGAIELPLDSSSDVDGTARAFAAANKATDVEILSVDVGHYDATSRTFAANAAPNDSVKVVGQRTVTLTFGPVIGIKTLTVGAHSVAQAFRTDSVTGLAMPWVIHLDTNTPISLCQTFTLKLDDSQAAGMWTVPNTSMSADEYRARIEGGFGGTVSVGDQIEFVTGTKQGPNDQGVNDRISQDPSATCQTVKGSSARLVVVPYIFGPLPAGSGGNQFLNIDGFAVFFLTESLNGGKQIVGQFQNLFAGKTINRLPPSQTAPNTALLVE
jgi:Flp pilus assembly protein TadG